MKFKSKDTINLRSSPSLSGTVVGKILAGTLVESDEYTWKAVTLPDGKKGFAAGEYLEKQTGIPTTPAVPEPVVPTVAKWFKPIRADKFVVTQKFNVPDSVNYPSTGHHPGVDYGTQGEENVPIYFVCDGEVIESGLGTYFGNYFFYYVPTVDRTFLYFHLRFTAPTKGKYPGGLQCGVAGNTGLSFGVHLHLECMKGKKTSTDRRNLLTSASALLATSDDPDTFLRSRI